MPAIVTAIAISMKDVLVNFGPPFLVGIAAMTVLAFIFPPEVVQQTLGLKSTNGVLAGVGGVLGLSRVSPVSSFSMQVAGFAELVAPLPAILLAGILAPGVAAVRFLAGLLFAFGLAKTHLEPGGAQARTEVESKGWRQLTATASSLFDRYLNSIIMAAVVAGVVGFAVPDAVVTQWLGSSRGYAPLLGAALGALIPAKGGAEAIVGATLLAKGAAVPAVLALVIGAPVLNGWTFRELASRLSLPRAGAIWLAVAGADIVVSSGAALLPGLQKI